MNDAYEALIAAARRARAVGYAVVVWTPEELGGAHPAHVEDRIIELSWDVIDALREDDSQRVRT